MNSHRRATMEPTGPATADPYRDNAFRLSGLAVDATPRQVRRRISELAAAQRLDAEAPPPSGIRPVTPHPGPQAVIDALTRLRDPVGRLWEELLWLWPAPGDGHSQDSLEAARRSWQEMSTGAPEASCVARHNIAVVDHIAALEWEPSDDDSSDGWQSVRRRRDKIANKWRSAYQHWRELLADGQCRSWLRSRVDAIGDPRLRPEAVDDILDGLPEFVLRSHAAVAVAAASSNRHSATAHVELMRDSGFDAATVDRVLVKACEPYVERLRELCRRSRDNQAGQADWAQAAVRLDEETRTGTDLRVARALLGHDHRVTSGIQDELASCTRWCVAAESNNSMYEYTSERLEWLRQGTEQLRRVLRLATAAHIRQQIVDDMVALLSNLVIGATKIALTAADADPVSGLSEHFELLSRTVEPLNRLDGLAPETAEELRVDAGWAAHQLLIVYVNNTKDAESAIDPMRELLKDVTDPQLRARVRKSVNDLQQLEQSLFPVGRDPAWTLPDFGDGKCILCGLQTGHTRIVVLRGFESNLFTYAYRGYRVMCCGDCVEQPIHTRGGAVAGVLGMTVLLVIIAFNLGPGWDWDSMWPVVAALGLTLSFVSWKIALVRRDRGLLGNDPDVGDAIASGWRYYSG